MKTSLPLSIARLVGIGLAVCVPALVVAQLPPFNANQVLRADQLNSLVNSVNALQANAINKANLYTVTDSSDPVPQNADALAQAFCADTNDVMVSCRCQGFQGTSNSLQFDLRQAGSTNTGTSFCICQGVNVGSAADRVLVATGDCLRVP